MGDNLNDFAEVFEQSKTIDSRLSTAEQNRNEFGSRFIVLPNPMYGAWEDAVYGEGRLSDQQKSEKRREVLKGY
jgi:predicted secreted acid phosphatase